MAKVSVVSANIPANQTSSGEVDLGSCALVAIEMPEAFSGSTISFQAKAKRSEDLGDDPGLEDWDDVYDSAGNLITWTVGANRVVVPTAAHAAAMAPLRLIRVVASGQNPGRILRFILKEGQ